ncbi:glutathione S-transferase APIC-like [Gossypium arboreum]|uniref:glutathione S-transferase APIC-like n=1 Tax=Gossypium arboreum TaxID=29729 RepID=UPI0022F19C9C|nr:glutathione S-transferase APIC-like [Gossypium arboreum]
MARSSCTKLQCPHALTAKVLACLHEHDAQFELVPISLLNGEHKQHAFLTKNPFGQIPALEDGRKIVSESRAISTYAVLDVYEKRLSNSKYLDRDFYSLADLHRLTYIYYLILVFKHGGKLFLQG